MSPSEASAKLTQAHLEAAYVRGMLDMRGELQAARANAVDARMGELANGDECDRLRAENARLRVALDHAAYALESIGESYTRIHAGPSIAASKARAALAQAT